MMKNSWHFCHVLHGILIVFGIAVLPVQAEENTALNIGPVDRTHIMHYKCFGVMGEICGEEFATMTVQKDGTRILRALLQSAPAPTSQGGDSYTQNNTFLRVSPESRPLEAYTSLYTGDNYWGSNLFIVEHSSFSVTVNTPTKQETATTPVPDRFGLVLFVNSGYGYLFGDYDREAGGAQPKKMCLLVPDDRATGCFLMDQTIEFIGNETITVPAGTFETEHFKMGEADTWVMGPDGIVVQCMHPRREGRAQLVDYEARP